MEKFDVVIVGAGLSGLACAHKLADEGLQVMVVERGDFPGSKNVTGGRLYLMPIRSLAGSMFDGAPFERKVVREQWSLLGGDSSVNVDFTGGRLRDEEHSYTVLRARLDRWLADKLTAKGVFVIPRYRVDDLIMENGVVAGIKAGGEEIGASVVVAADGVLSFMAEKARLREKMAPSNFAVAMKEIIQLSEEKINDRFNVEGTEGCARLCVGDVTKGIFGGGFLYTNKDTISLGVVAGIKALKDRPDPTDVHAFLDLFKERYEIKRLLDGGSLVEYSAHLIPEGGYDALSRLYGDGILVVGDAAGFALNMGVTVRGMEFAVASGIIAAQTISDAAKTGDFSARTLSAYKERLEKTFVLQDMKAMRESLSLLDNDDFFSFYPKQFPRFVENAMWFGEGPKQNVGKTIREEAKNSGMLSFKRLKDLYNLRKF